MALGLSDPPEGSHSTRSGTDRSSSPKHRSMKISQCRRRELLGMRDTETGTVISVRYMKRSSNAGVDPERGVQHMDRKKAWGRKPNMCKGPEASNMCEMAGAQSEAERLR